MSVRFSCPNCGKYLDSETEVCPHCQVSLNSDFNQENDAPLADAEPISIPVSGRWNIPRLGEYLIELGLIDSNDLKLALDHQHKKTSTGHTQLFGQTLLEMDLIDRSTFNQVILDQLLSLQSELEINKKYGDFSIHGEQQESNENRDHFKIALDLTQNTIMEITQARTFTDILHIIATTFHRCPFKAKVLLQGRDGNYVILTPGIDPQSQVSKNHQISSQSPTIVQQDIIEDYFDPSNAVQIVNLSHPSTLPIEILDIVQLMGCAEVAFLPITQGSQILALIILGSAPDQILSKEHLDPYLNLAMIFSVSLKRQAYFESMEKRLVTLQTLDTAMKAITTETNLSNLYRTIHEQITRALGRANFLIGLLDNRTDTIEVPYAYENTQPIDISPLKIGEGLISIVIQSRQPLLLGENISSRAKELGVKLIFDHTKSWLGVPLIIGTDILGAMVIQDPEQDHRFDQEDMRLLNLIATQVAITIRNALLLEETQRRVDRDRIVTDITSKIWSSPDIDHILRTAIQELGRSMEASDAMIQLEAPPVKDQVEGI